MADNFEASFEEVNKLVTIDERNREQYLSSAYREPEARKDFIDKFWTALGWYAHTLPKPSNHTTSIPIGAIGSVSELLRTQTRTD